MATRWDDSEVRRLALLAGVTLVFIALFAPKVSDALEPAARAFCRSLGCR